MKYVLVFLFVACQVMWHPLFSQTKKNASVQGGWRSFDAGLENAKVIHKKILVDVYTDWCGWCKKMDEKVYSDPRVREYLTKNFVIVKMNAEAEGTIHYKGKTYSPSQLASAFGVTGYPATLFLEEDSDAITLLPGYMEAPMFLHVLSFVAENQYGKKQFDQYLKEKGVGQ
jgi:thioredoxin-related protein